MELIIDTSAIIAVLVHEAQRKEIVAATTSASLLAPASLHWEIGNAFSAMLRRGRLGLSGVQRALKTYEQIPVRFVRIDMGDAIRIAEKHDIYAYDAYFIVAAQYKRCGLLTLDRGLQRAAQNQGIELIDI